jgi:hypothetical protein
MFCVLGTLDLGEKVTAVELGRISTQDNCVGIEGKNCLHSFPVFSRDLIPASLSTVMMCSLRASSDSTTDIFPALPFITPLP